MATRMQQRRGTAAQWTSSNPVLNAGEMGWESDTNKFKIGDGTNHWADIDYFIDANSTVSPSFGTSITFEGATADSFETTLQVTDPTADRTITIPNASGTIITTGNLSDITDIGVFTSTITMEGATANDHELTISAGDPTADRTATFPDATGTIVLDTATQTLTNKTLTTPTISSIINSAATLTLPTSTGTVALTTDIPAGVVTESGTQTLTNKTLTSPVVSGLILSDSSIVIEGSTANDFETTLTVTDPTADRTITLPDVTGTVVTTGNLSDITSVGTLASLTVTGDLTVNGTTTTINSTTLTVDDKNIVLGDVETPTDTTADGGGITLKGATDKTFNWVDSTDSWTSSEHMDLASGKVLKINGTEVLSATQYTGNAATVTNGITTASKISALAATSSSELAGVISDETGSGSLVFATAPTLTNAVEVNPILTGPEERWSVSGTGASGTVNLDVLTSGVLYSTGNATGNWTLNVRGDGSNTLNNSLATNDSITVVFFATNGGTPYSATGFTVDGSAVTPKWQNGTAPSAGNANSIDIYSYTIVKTGSATFTVFGSQTRFA